MGRGDPAHGNARYVAGQSVSVEALPFVLGVEVVSHVADVVRGAWTANGDHQLVLALVHLGGVGNQPDALPGVKVGEGVGGLVLDIMGRTLRGSAYVG